MNRRVLLSICGKQTYMGQEPDVIELVTEGVLSARENGWVLEYQETELTGLEGVTTTFEINNDEITLKRTGKLNSQMVFREGVTHDSLYQMEFGALMLSVCASHIHWELSENGGVIDLVYGIEIEHANAGEITYHLDVRPAE